MAALTLSCLLMVLTSCLAPPPVSAQVSLKIWPTTLELSVAEGQTVEGIVSVENAGDETVHLIVYALDYAVDASGSYVFSQPTHSTYSCSAWVETDFHSFDLAPGKTQAVTVTVRVPSHVEPGGHYSALLFEQTSDIGSGTAISVGARLACLLYATVPGVTDAEIVANAEIAQLVLPGWTDGGPIGVSALVRNSGNVHLTVAARAYFTDLRGSHIGEIDLGQVVVLPGGERLLGSIWNDLPIFGRVTARVVIGYRDAEGALVNKEASANFQIVPWKVIMATVCPLVLVGATVFVVSRKCRLRLSLERRRSS